MEAFYSLYPGVKHTHILLVCISVTLFIGRFILLLRQSPALQRKWLKITPHVIDTLLLLSGLLLCVLIRQYPFVDLWLTEKIVAVIAYIGFAVVAMRAQGIIRYAAFIGALGWALYAAKMAYFKQALLIG